MEPEWLSYQEVADRLGVTPEAARSRAKRLRWRRQMGNDGRALVLVALEPRPPGDQPMTPRLPPGRKAVDPALVTALESHIKTLQGDNETLKEQLAAEQAKTSQAIAAFASLAERLDALAEANQRRPWWKRLAG